MTSLDEDYNKKIEERESFKPDYITANLSLLDKCEKTEASNTCDGNTRTIEPPVNSNLEHEFYTIKSSNEKIFFSPSRIMSKEEFNQLKVKFDAIDPKYWYYPKLPDPIYAYYLKNIKGKN